MPMSNAERQRIHRNRIKARLQDEPGEVARLTAEVARLRIALTVLSRSDNAGASLDTYQARDRAELVADLLSSRAWWRKPSKKPPRFLGFDRDQWGTAPPELVAYFGLTEAVRKGMDLMQRDLHENLERRARRVKNNQRYDEFLGQ